MLSLLSLAGHAANVESPPAKPEVGAALGSQPAVPAASNPGVPYPEVPPPQNQVNKNYPLPGLKRRRGKQGGASSLRRRHNYGRDSSDGYYGSSSKGYGNKGYGGDYSGETNAYGYGYSLVDDYICDLDASILVVTNSEKRYNKPSKSYGGGGKDYGGGYDKNSYGKKFAESYGDKKSSEEGGYGSHGNSYEEASGSGEGYGNGGSSYRRRPKRGAYDGGYGNNNNDDGGYGGGSYGKKKAAYYSVAKAHRLRCSAIAIGSDVDCTSCCQLAARKDRSVTRNSIIGFIVDYDEVQEQPDYGTGAAKSSSDYGTENKRYKRGADAYGAQSPAYGPTESYNKETTGYKKAEGDSYGSVGASYGGGKKPTYYAPEKPYVSYPKCVCCAPKSRVSYGGKSYGGKAKSGYGYGGDSEESAEESKEYGSGNYENEEEDGGYGSEEKNSSEEEGDYNHKSKKHHHHHHHQHKKGGGGYKNSKSDEEY